MDRQNVFDVVSPENYHATLIRMWTRVVKDGMIRKDDERAFTELGKYFVGFVIRNGGLPDYGVVVGWVPELIGR